MRPRLALLVGIGVGFVLGFISHWGQLNKPFEAIIAYSIRDAGNCDLMSMLRAPFRWWTLQRGLLSAESGTKLAETAADGFTRWDTPMGTLWAPPGNSPTFAVGEQLAGVYNHGPMALGPDDVVLDCGANVGTFTMRCIRAGVKKIVAIEPSPNNIEALHRSFKREIAAGQVVIVPKGVWHQDSTLPMYTYENSLLNSFVMPVRRENMAGPPRRIDLPLTTVDKIVEELRLDKVTFIKMDVEGAERNAIRGAVATIRRDHPRLSLATENLESDFIAVPEEVRKVDPRYDAQCGLCRQTGRFSYRPDILYFTPQ